MDTASLTEELKKSFFIRMKVPADQAEAFIERIVSLPPEKREKALKIVQKAEKAFAEFAEQEAEKAKTFTKTIEEFKNKTTKKYQKKGKTLNKSSGLFSNLKSKIKKQ